MGLPVWRAPSPEPKDALKADLAAPARSPIRRRRLTRSPRSPRLPGSSFPLNLPHISSQRIQPHIDLEPATRPSSSHRRLLPPPVPELRMYARPSQPAAIATGLPAADEESSSRSYFRLSTDAPRGLSLEARRPLPALTPNFAPALASRNAARDSPNSRDPSASRSRSPRRTHRLREVFPQPSPMIGPNPPTLRRTRLSDLRAHRNGNDDGSDSDAVGFPPLRRMGRRTIADGPLPSSSLRESWSPATTLDGLGDRERSLSPDEDHWDTMQSSVAPDPLAPTADSSFTSAAATASFSNSHPSSRAGSSNSNSASSSLTHLTVPSRRESLTLDQFLRACDGSDEDSASDTEEEDLDDSHHAMLPGPFMPYHPPARNPYRYSRHVRDQSHEASAYVRSFYGEVTEHDVPRQPERLIHGRLDGPAEDRNTGDDEMGLDQELRDARALLERLSRRDDISDEFWASVGLRRPLADRVERIQQRERL